MSNFWGDELRRWIGAMNWGNELGRWIGAMNLGAELRRWIEAMNWGDELRRWIEAMNWGDELRRWIEAIPFDLFFLNLQPPNAATARCQLSSNCWWKYFMRKKTRKGTYKEKCSRYNSFNEMIINLTITEKCMLTVLWCLLTTTRWYLLNIFFFFKLNKFWWFFSPKTYINCCYW